MVRRFNRCVTQRIGALDDAFLSAPRPLGHSRVLWEVGVDGADARSLRRSLGLDSGHLSRVLRALEAEQLVVVRPSTYDARVRVVQCTRAGLEELARLDARSDHTAAAALAPLTSTQQQRLLAAMAEVELLLTASAVVIDHEDPSHPDAVRSLSAYFTELTERFDIGFDPARTLPAAPDDLRPPRGLLLLARLDGQPIGCAALKLHGSQAAEVKRMWVAPSARGLGLGRRLLQAVEQLAADHGARLLRLETNRNLTEAIALYRSTGYQEVPAFNDEPFAHHWFQKKLQLPLKTPRTFPSTSTD